MTLTAIFLLIISAVTHAGWNYIGKRERPSTSFMLVANAMGIFVLLPFILFYTHTLIQITTRAWTFILLTGLAQAVYYFSLAGAYRKGQMSIVYPLARSIPLLIVTLITHTFGIGKAVTLPALIGFCLVIVGGFILPMKHWSDFSPKNYLNITCLFAFLAAVGTAGYSIFDNMALAILRESDQIILDNTRITILYAFMEVVSGSIWLSAFLFFSRPERENLKRVITSNKKNAALVGFGIYFTYLLVLLSMAYVTNVSYVVAFRQLSIPIGAIMAISLLKEPKHAPKFTGISIIFLGLILVAI